MGQLSVIERRKRAHNWMHAITYLLKYWDQMEKILSPFMKNFAWFCTYNCPLSLTFTLILCWELFMPCLDRHKHAHTHTQQSERQLISNIKSTHIHTQSNIDAVCPWKLGHVRCQCGVGGENFDWKIPTESVNVHMLSSHPHGDFRLVLQHSGRLHRPSGSDKLTVQHPPQGNCAQRKSYI